MTTTELRDLFATVLVGVLGGEPHAWEDAIGCISVHPLSTHPSSNWTIAPAGDHRELRAIANAEQIIRQEHPYVDRG